MFCRRKNDSSGLSCEIKLVSEIISILSMIFSSFVIFVAVKYTKLNIINILVLQILISEVIDGITILLVIFDDVQYPRSYENYYSRRGICFSQIFLALFVCLWTLTASFFIALRIYDITVKKGIIFRKKIMKKSHIFSILFPLFISFWFWVGQTSYQVQQNTTYDVFYQSHSSSRSHFKHLYCWYEKNVNYAIFAIAVVLIFSDIFFSVKGLLVMKSIRIKITEELEGSFSSSKKKTEVEHIIKTLWIYPISSAVLWIIYFILQIFFFFELKQVTVISLIYCIIISIRQPIYTLILLFTQKDIKNEFIKTILCKRKKKNKSVIYRLDQNNSIISQNSEF